jgi:hypothetical protein
MNWSHRSGFALLQSREARKRADCLTRVGGAEGQDLGGMRTVLDNVAGSSPSAGTILYLFATATWGFHRYGIITGIVLLIVVRVVLVFCTIVVTTIRRPHLILNVLHRRSSGLAHDASPAANNGRGRGEEAGFGGTGRTDRRGNRGALCVEGACDAAK